MLKLAVKQQSFIESSQIMDCFAEKIASIKHELKENYLKDSSPWVVTYSGGKDSTMTLQLVLETIAQNPKKEVHVLYADTRVEPPPVVDHARRLLEKIGEWAKKYNLPVVLNTLYPELKDSFFVLLLGKGYLPPTRWFRWCTERLKVRPIKKYIKGIIETYGRCVVLLGLRAKESVNRDKRLKSRGYSKWMPFEGLKGATIYAPILELSTEDVWKYLLQNQPPWGADNYLLRALYTAGNTSCSLFCGGIRFGCWVCTVVKRDKCTNGLSNLPEWEWLAMLMEYRDKLIEIRNNPANRVLKRVNGKSYLGPLKLEVRKKLYNELKELEKIMGYRILSPAENCLILEYLQKQTS